MTEVFLNGKFAGDVEDPVMFIDQFKTERRKGSEQGSISKNVNIKYDDKSNIVAFKLIFLFADCNPFFLSPGKSEIYAYCFAYIFKS